MIQENLRGSVHEILERWKNCEEPFGNKLKVAVTQVVHKINVVDIAINRS